MDTEHEVPAEIEAQVFQFTKELLRRLVETDEHGQLRPSATQPCAILVTREAMDASGDLRSIQASLAERHVGFPPVIVVDDLGYRLADGLYDEKVESPADLAEAQQPQRELQGVLSRNQDSSTKRVLVVVVAISADPDDYQVTHETAKLFIDAASSGEQPVSFGIVDVLPQENLGWQALLIDPELTEAYAWRAYNRDSAERRRQSPPPTTYDPERLRSYDRQIRTALDLQIARRIGQARRETFPDMRV